VPNQATRTQLLTDELRKTIPAMYTTETEEDPTVHCKFFDPCSQWTWYVIEFDGEDRFFGLVVGFVVELGYFSLEELETVCNPLGLHMERDLGWKPCPLSEVQANRK
jgi:hypothetical protein